MRVLFFTYLVLVVVEVGLADERLADEGREEQRPEGESEAVLAQEALHRAINPIEM